MANTAGTAGDLTAWLAQEAHTIGIDRIAVADPARRPSPELLAAHLDAGRHAGMAYLARHRELRLDPAGLLPGLRSIVCAAWAHPTEVLSGEGEPQIARYALAPDYHRALGEMLHRLLARLRERVPGVHGRVAVDTAPILERHWAVAAGLGWWGHSGSVIVPGLGSWVLLGELLLDVDLACGAPIPERCGDCDRCRRACPTGALIGPGLLDARRCIAYWTVEHRGEFAAGTPRLSPWLFGCDRCQEVCPWNRPDRRGSPGESRRAAEVPAWDLDEWLQVAPEEFELRLKSTALERAGWVGLRRNALRLRSERAREP